MKRFMVEDDIVDNVKVFDLPAEDFRHWIFCLAIASRMDPRGTLPDLHALAHRLRTTDERAGEIIVKLVSHRLVDRTRTGVLKMHDWDKHQVKERDWGALKAAQRAKAKGQILDANGHVHVDVRADKCGRPRGLSTDEYSEEVRPPTEVLNSSVAGASRVKDPPRPPRRRGGKNSYPTLTPEQTAALKPEAPRDVD